jgi:hypothetical protein
LFERETKLPMAMARINWRAKVEQTEGMSLCCISKRKLKRVYCKII